MRQYYYTLAALPMLDYDSEPMPGTAALFGICENDLSIEDWELFQRARLVPPREAEDAVTDGVPAPPVSMVPNNADGLRTLRSWLNWERFLRGELAVQRARRLGLDPSEYTAVAEFEVGVPDVVREALNEESPFAAEEILNWARWTKLNELESGHHFDIAKLIVYSLRMQLLERRARFTAERGIKGFDAAYSSVAEAPRLETTRHPKDGGES